MYLIRPNNQRKGLKGVTNMPTNVGVLIDSNRITMKDMKIPLTLMPLDENNSPLGMYSAEIGKDYYFPKAKSVVEMSILYSNNKKKKPKAQNGMSLMQQMQALGMNKPITGGSFAQIPTTIDQQKINLNPPKTPQLNLNFGAKMKNSLSGIGTGSATSMLSGITSSLGNKKNDKTVDMTTSGETGINSGLDMVADMSPGKGINTVAKLGSGLIESLSKNKNAGWGYNYDSKGESIAKGSLEGIGKGASIGSFAGPIGTIVGGAVGGIAGAFRGLYKGKKAKTEAEKLAKKKTNLETARRLTGSVYAKQGGILMLKHGGCGCTMGSDGVDLDGITPKDMVAISMKFSNVDKNDVKSLKKVAKQANKRLVDFIEDEFPDVFKKLKNGGYVIN